MTMLCLVQSESAYKYYEALRPIVIYARVFALTLTLGTCGGMNILYYVNLRCVFQSHCEYVALYR